MSCLSVHHYTSAVECYKKEKKRQLKFRSVYTQILLFSRVSPERCHLKNRSSSSVPAALMSAVTSSGKHKNVSTLLPVSHEKKYNIAHMWITTPIQADNNNPLWRSQCKQRYEWDAASDMWLWCDKMKPVMWSTDAPQRSWHRKLFSPLNYNHMLHYSYPVTHFEWIEEKSAKKNRKSEVQIDKLLEVKAAKTNVDPHPSLQETLLDQSLQEAAAVLLCSTDQAVWLQGEDVVSSQHLSVN